MAIIAICLTALIIWWRIERIIYGINWNKDGESFSISNPTKREQAEFMPPPTAEEQEQWEQEHTPQGELMKHLEERE